MRAAQAMLQLGNATSRTRAEHDDKVSSIGIAISGVHIQKNHKATCARQIRTGSGTN